MAQSFKPSQFNAFFQQMPNATTGTVPKSPLYPRNSRYNQHVQNRKARERMNINTSQALYFADEYKTAGARSVPSGMDHQAPTMPDLPADPCSLMCDISESAPDVLATIPFDFADIDEYKTGRAPAQNGMTNDAAATSYEWTVDVTTAEIRNSTFQQSFQSPIFSVFGCKWSLKLYPGGYHQQGHGRVSLCLALASYQPKMKSIRLKYTLQCIETGTEYSSTNTLVPSLNKIAQGWPLGTSPRSQALKHYKSLKFKARIELVEVRDIHGRDITDEHANMKTIVRNAITASGKYRWKIPDPSLVHQQVKSPPFSAAGFTWRLSVHVARTPRNEQCVRLLLGLLKLPSNLKRISIAYTLQCVETNTKYQTVKIFDDKNRQWSWSNNLVPIIQIQACKAQLTFVATIDLVAVHGVYYNNDMTQFRSGLSSPPMLASRSAPANETVTLAAAVPLVQSETPVSSPLAVASPRSRRAASCALASPRAAIKSYKPRPRFGSGFGPLAPLFEMLEAHHQLLKQSEPSIDEFIAKQQDMHTLQAAKCTALQTEQALIEPLLQIHNLPTFLQNIITVENMFNSKYESNPEQRQIQQKARETCENKTSIVKFEHNPKPLCHLPDHGAASFTGLLAAANVHTHAFKMWMQLVVSACEVQNIRIVSKSEVQMKNVERAFYKAFYVYGRSAERIEDGHKQITDMLRCSMVFDDFDCLYRCYKLIEELSAQPQHGVGGILRVKDRFVAERVPFGYRYLLINMYAPNSRIVVEIQLHHLLFYENKQKSHDIYKQARLFENENGENTAYQYADQNFRNVVPNHMYNDQPTSPTYTRSKTYRQKQLRVQNNFVVDERGVSVTYGELFDVWRLSGHLNTLIIEPGYGENDEAVLFSIIHDISSKRKLKKQGLKEGEITKFRTYLNELKRTIQKDRRWTNWTF